MLSPRFLSRINMLGFFYPLLPGWLSSSVSHSVSPPPAPIVHDEPSYASPTIFSSNTAKQHSDQARRKILAKTETKDLYCGAPMLNRDQAIKLLEKMQSVLSNPKNSSINSVLGELIGSLKKTEGEAIPLEQWANISLRLEQLLDMLKEYDNKNLATMSYLPFIKLNIQRLESVSRYMWMRLTHEKLIKIFTEEVTKLSVENPSFNKVRAKKMFLEASTPIPFLSVGLEPGVQDSQYFDDEGYLITSDVISGSVALSAKVPLAKATAQGTYTSGNYRYARFARAHAICNFCELLEKHKKSPDVAPFLSRKAVLGMPWELGNTEEMSDFYAVQKDYIRDEQLITRSFSLLLSLDYSDPGKRIKPDPLVAQEENAAKEKERNDRAAIQHTTKVDLIAGKKAVLLNGKLTTKTGAVKGTLGFDESFMQFNGSVSGEWSKKKTCATRYATFCELLQNTYITDAFRGGLKTNLEKNSLALRRNLYRFWHPDPLVFTSAEVEHHYDKNHVLFMRKVVNNEDVDFDFHIQKPDAIGQDISCLKQDFEFYSNLHTQHAQGNSQTEGAIDAFHAKYGVKSTEECLQQMATLTAYYFSRLTGEKTAESATLRTQLLELETAIHATGIPHRPDVLRELACAQQNYFIKTDDKTVYASFKSGLTFSTAFGDLAELGCKINFRKLLHFNPLRSGDYINIDFTLGTDLGANQRFLQSLSGYFEGEGLLDLAQYFKPDNFGTGTAKAVYTFKFFKPTGSGELPRVLLYERVLGQTGFEFSPKVHIPIPGITNLTLGYTSSGSDIHLVEDKPTPDSMLFFGIHYLHALFTTKTTVKDREKGTDTINQDSYWHVLIRDHEPIVKQLFLNFATHDDREPHRLKQELEFIKDRFFKFASEEDKAKINVKIQNLINSAKAFRGAPNNDAAYAKVLTDFKIVLQNLFPHWMMTRERSEAYGTWGYSLAEPPVSADPIVR